MSASVAPSDECLRGEGLVWLTGADRGVFASYCRGSNYCSIARSMDGRISAAAPLTLADQLPLLNLMFVKRSWSGLVFVRCAI